jgi:hypothetical protein
MKSLILFLTIVALGAAAVPAASATSRSSLTIRDANPATVVGRGFLARERVVVRVRPIGSRSFAKAVSSTAAGRFVAVFAEEAIPDCAGYVVTATGARGSRATLRRLIPPPGCGVDPQP